VVLHPRQGRWTDPAWWFFLIWLPDFFKKTRHLDIKEQRLHAGDHLWPGHGAEHLRQLLTGALLNAGWSITRARKTSMFLTALCVWPVMAVKDVGDCPRC